MALTNRSLATLSSPDDSADFLEFEQLLNQYDYATPQRGQLLTGTIVDTSDRYLVVDVGLKHDAFIPRMDLERIPEKLRPVPHIGLSLEMVVIRPADAGGDLIVSASKALERKDWDRATSMMGGDETFDALVTGYNKGGLITQFGKLKGFLPQSHVDTIPRNLSEQALEDSKAAMIGQTLHVGVIEVDELRGRLIVSEKAARQKARQNRLRQLEVGQVLTGPVVGITQFGAFVSLGGVDGLVHISKLANRHIDDPHEVVALGEEVTVRIDAVDVERERVSLNRAALLPDPWDDVTYEIGQLVTGRVRSVTEYGLFVTLDSGADGLIHLSEMQYSLARVGEEIPVRILQVDAEKRRINLSLDGVTGEEREAWTRERPAVPVLE